jgi:cytochrome c556
MHSITSVHSTASRPTSFIAPQIQRTNSRSGGYESDQSFDTSTENESIQTFNFPPVPSSNAMPAIWQTRRQESGSAVSRLSQKFAANIQIADIVTPPAPFRASENDAEDDTHSRSSTLGGNDQDFDFPEKTPTPLARKTIDIMLDDVDQPTSVAPPSHIPGPLESQLAALMTKLVHIERSNPVASITPSDYAALTAELHALRAEKATWQKRHEALYALRDEDVENNIKIRGMLAKARRELEAMTKLRDEDLVNVQAVRIKLADATRELDRSKTLNPNGNANGRTSPSRGRPGSFMLERRGTIDLFAAAKAAALEQRALELERRNEDLVEQIKTLKGGSNVDDLNRLTAHKAWKDTVADMEGKLKAKDEEITRLRSTSTSSSVMSSSSTLGAGAGLRSTSGPEWQRMEALHEEHASYRERVGGKMQALRSEKEGLQRDLHRKEDECHALEAKVQSLQRRLAVM